VSRDPIGYEDGQNLYAAYFIPGRTDPLGLCYTCTPWVTKKRNCTTPEHEMCDNACKRQGKPGGVARICSTSTRNCKWWFGLGGWTQTTNAQVCKCFANGTGECSLVSSVPQVGGCFKCTYNCKGTAYFGNFQRIVRYQRGGCHPSAKVVRGFATKEACQQSAPDDDPIVGIGDNDYIFE